MSWRIPLLATGTAALIVSLAILTFGQGDAATMAQRLADKSPNAVPVDVELVLAVDVSYSMDPDEQACSVKAISWR
jgi:hypothetical protein